MTMPDERTRALLWAGGFLIELARDNRLPLDIRRHAVVIARHFPTIEDVSALALFRYSSGPAIGLALPDEVPFWAKDCRYGPLSHSTRLAWPTG
ncbi:BPSL0761 family protein [Solilutibacter silvestris]|uniref:BPSL0761 family protein n=1 Tax=Solilutibacter silvestris TaxID=1645665 RepID=UPI000CA08693